MSNTFGKNIRLTTFGESHGPAMGGVIDGFPPGFKIDIDKLHAFIMTRRPGQGRGVTTRCETDMPEFLSGLTSDMITLGTPIGFIVRNTDTRSSDYSELEHIYRPNHADYTYQCRYGIRDFRGGGRASARETLCRVVAGGFALQWLESKNITIEAQLISVAGSAPGASYEDMMSIVEAARKDGDSLGGVVKCIVKGVPAGIGNPVYDKLNASLAQAMMSINAAVGFSIGDGFGLSEMKGSEAADCFEYSGGRIHTLTNHCGGIQGGISNGEDIVMTIAFKPTPTIARELRTVTDTGDNINLKSRGRHDACVAIRAVPVVTAMAALSVADFLERVCF